jgi:hypothetical protein
MSMKKCEACSTKYRKVFHVKEVCPGRTAPGFLKKRWREIIVPYPGRKDPCP